MESSPLERHYDISDIAGMLKLSTDTVRRIFRKEPGVVVLNSPPKKYKRGYSTIRVPESVLLRVHRRLTNVAA